MEQPEVFDEIDLLNLCLCECSTKNQNHSFQVSFLHIDDSMKMKFFYFIVSVIIFNCLVSQYVVGGFQALNGSVKL